MLAFEPRFTITNAITATDDDRAGAGFLQAATLSEEWVRRMSQRALLLEAHHTTHIEGTHLTLEPAWNQRVVEYRHKSRHLLRQPRDLVTCLF